MKRTLFVEPGFGKDVELAVRIQLSFHFEVFGGLVAPGELGNPDFLAGIETTVDPESGSLGSLVDETEFPAVRNLVVLVVMLPVVLSADIEGTLRGEEAEGVSDIGAGREDSQSKKVIEGEAAVLHGGVSLEVDIVFFVLLDVCEAELMSLRVPASSS